MEKRFSSKLFLALFPLILAAGVGAGLIWSGGGLNLFQKTPPIEKLQIQNIRLPEEGVIQIPVVNEGPDPLTISQVMVDEAYWNFSISPSSTLDPREKAVVTIPYMWVHGAKHEVTLITRRGITFKEEIPVAITSPQFSTSTFLQFGLIGMFVGVIPVLLGLLWFPFMKTLSTQWMNFILALTVGLLVYLAVGTGIDALEFTEKIPRFFQGISLIFFVTLLTMGILFAFSPSDRGDDHSQISLAYRIALGIGLHNLGEGLAIGAAFSTGELSLGLFLVIGFALHNITEGVGIAAPVVREAPGFMHFAGFVAVGGGPAVLGMWFGGFAFSPVLAAIFFAAGLGAILQVVWDVSHLIYKRSLEAGIPLLNGLNYGGFLLGVLLMYATGYFIK